MESFIGTSYVETTATLTALRALGSGDVVAARIDRELAARRHPLPDWLAGLDRAQVEPDVWFMTHVLGDGDEYLLGVVLPSGEALSALVYVDHDMGTVVKDAFVVPEPLEDLALKMGTQGSRLRPRPRRDPVGTDRLDPAVVDRYEPEYPRLIRGERQLSVAALAEALLESERVEHLSDEVIHLEYVADEVGGLDWAGIPAEIRATVRARGQHPRGWVSVTITLPAGDLAPGDLVGVDRGRGRGRHTGRRRRGAGGAPNVAARIPPSETPHIAR